MLQQPEADGLTAPAVLPAHIKYKSRRQALDSRRVQPLQPGQVVFAGHVVISREKAVMLVSVGSAEELLRQVRLGPRGHVVRHRTGSV